jgi:hypothetical protein
LTIYAGKTGQKAVSNVLLEVQNILDFFRVFSNVTTTTRRARYTAKFFSLPFTHIAKEIYYK